MPRGGARPGSGRKTKATELQVSKLCQRAIVAHYGSIPKGIKFLLQSGEPALVKWAWEHALGKPPDIIKADVTTTVIQIKRGNRNPIE